MANEQSEHNERNDKKLSETKKMDASDGETRDSREGRDREPTQGSGSRLRRREIKLSSLFFSDDKKGGDGVNEASDESLEATYTDSTSGALSGELKEGGVTANVDESILAEALREATICRSLLEETEITKKELEELEKVTRALQRQNILLNRQVVSGLTEIKKIQKQGGGAELSLGVGDEDDLVVAIERQQLDNNSLSEQVAMLFKDNKEIMSALHKVSEEASLALVKCQELDNYLAHADVVEAEQISEKSAEAARDEDQILELVALAESALIQVRGNTSDIEESRVEMQRQMVAVEAIKDDCLHAELELRAQGGAIIEQLETLREEISQCALGAKESADAAQHSLNRAEEAARASMANLADVQICREEVESVADECRSLMEKSKGFVEANAELLKRVEHGDQIQRSLQALDGEMQQVMDEVVVCQERSEQLEIKAKEHLDLGQDCLEKIAALTDQVEVVELLSDERGERVDSVIERLEQGESDIVALHKNVADELQQTREVRKQILSIKDHAQSLLLDFREALDEQELAPEFDSSQFEVFLHELRGDQSIIKEDVDNLQTALTDQQKKMDVMIADQSEKNRTLLDLFEQYKSEHLFSADELQEARTILAQLKSLAAENKSACDSVDQLSAKVGRWLTEGEANREGLQEQTKQVQEALTALEERQSLLNFVTKDSERLNQLVKQAVDECQQLNERVDLMIEESLKQQEQFKDDAEEILMRAEGHERRVQQISDKGEGVIQSIEAAQLQAQSAALESSSLLEQMSTARAHIDEVAQECETFCKESRSFKESTEQLLDTATKSVFDQIESSKQQLESVRTDIESKFSSSADLQCVMENMKRELQGLYDTCQWTLNSSAQRDEKVDKLLQYQKRFQSQADCLFDQCQSLYHISERNSEEQAERFAELYALSEKIEERQNDSDSLIDLQQQRNREFEALLEKASQSGDQMAALEARVEAGIADLDTLTQANQKAQKVVYDNIRFVRALQKRVNSNGEQNDAICCRFSAFENELVEKNRILEKTHQDTLQLQQTVSERLDAYSKQMASHADQMALYQEKSEAHQKEVSENLDRSNKAMTIAQHSCKEVKRLSQQTLQRLTMMDALQDEADKALKEYDRLSQQNRENQKAFDATLKEVLRQRAKSVALQLEIQREYKESRQRKKELGELHNECSALLVDAKNQVTKGEVQARRVETIEGRLEQLLKASEKLTKQSAALLRDTRKRHEAQEKQYDNVVDITQRLTEQQQQSERILAQHSDRTAALDAVIKEQAELISEQKSGIVENQALKEKVSTLLDAGKRTTRIVVKHIHEMRSIEGDVKARSNELFKRHEKIESLERRLGEQNNRLDQLLERTEQLTISAEASVQQCQRVSDAAERHVDEAKQEREAIREMAQTTRQFEQSCFEIKSDLEADAKKVQALHQETERWVQETDQRFSQALDENQKLLEDTRSSNVVLKRSLNEQESHQKKLQGVIAEQDEQLAAAKQQLERWHQRWQGAETWQSEQKILADKVRMQLNDAIDHAQRLQANVEEKELLNQALKQSLEKLSKQSQLQQKTIAAAEALAERSEARETRLERQLQESMALNSTLSERLKALEPYTTHIKSALHSAEKYAEEAGIANKEVGVTQRELQVSIVEIKNALKAVQLQMEGQGNRDFAVQGSTVADRPQEDTRAREQESAMQRIRALEQQIERLTQSSSDPLQGGEQRENRDVRESRSEFDPTEAPAQTRQRAPQGDDGSPGLDEPYIVSPITDLSTDDGAERTEEGEQPPLSGGERPKKSFKSFLH